MTHKVISNEQSALFHKQINNANTIAIFGHQHMDGDCVGSVLSLGQILKKKGKKVSYFTSIAPDKSFSWIQEFDQIQTQMDYSRKADLHIFVDFSPLSRIPSLTDEHQDYFESISTIVIDHHHGDYENALLNIKDVDAPSCAEWLLELYTARDRLEYIDEPIATAMYMWIMMDTGNFMYDGNSSRTLRNAATLVELGADKNAVVFNMLRSRNFGTMKYVQIVLDRLSTYKNTIMRSYVIEDEREDLKLTKKDREYGQFIIQQIAGFPLTMLFKIQENAIKMSFRSREKEMNNGIEPIIANLIAEKFWWWWHTNAAWAKVKRNHRDPLEQIEEILEQVLVYTNRA